ncbi:MAG: hypothetical protein HC848_11290 [Limnobacter sp.]|nr:hypothetical protein [Limnobacter sp.]
MISFSDSEMLKALAKWVNLIRTPFYQEQPAHQVIGLGSFDSSNHLHSRLELRKLGQTSMEFCWIHELLRTNELREEVCLQSEVNEFNHRMEVTRLPCYIWLNAERGVLELYWHETLNSSAQLDFARHMFNHSYYLASSLRSKTFQPLLDKSQLCMVH